MAFQIGQNQYETAKNTILDFCQELGSMEYSPVKMKIRMEFGDFTLIQGYDSLKETFYLGEIGFRDFTLDRMVELADIIPDFRVLLIKYLMNRGKLS